MQVLLIGSDSKLQLNKDTQGDEDVHPLSRAKISKIWQLSFCFFVNIPFHLTHNTIKGEVMRDKKSAKTSASNSNNAKSKKTTKSVKDCK